MKRQLWINTEEAELLRNALQFWCVQLDKERAMTDRAHVFAGHFVARRANELQERIKTLFAS